MTMIGTVTLGIALFFTAVAMVLAYTCLVMASPVKRIASRTVPRAKIPTDWDRLQDMTKIEEK